MGKILEVSNLTIHIKTHKGIVQAVRDVNFYLNEQETLAVVGESGSGKSITMKGIMGILPKNGKVTEGTVMYNGKDLTKYTEREMQTIRGSEIAMVFQDPMTSLNPTMRIGKQIEEMLKAHKKDMTAEQRKARAIELLSLVGISNPEERYKQYPHQLSGGMRQRVVIAIALACDPKVLIADEPTTALDVTIQAQILDLMNQLKKETGTSILFITHDLGVVAEVCDDVAVMYCGRVVERGDVKTIFANPSHPYTKGLLGSIPRLGDAGKELKSIPGNVPNPKYMPKGCKFEPRCPYASEKCREEEPGFFQIEEGHISRCWLCESGQLKTDHVEKAGD